MKHCNMPGHTDWMNCGVCVGGGGRGGTKGGADVVQPLIAVKLLFVVV